MLFDDLAGRAKSFSASVKVYPSMAGGVSVTFSAAITPVFSTRMVNAWDSPSSSMGSSSGTVVFTTGAGTEVS